MSKTRHIHQRMSQRGINQRMLDIVGQFGVAIGDKVILDQKNIQQLLNAIDSLRSDFVNLKDKGGLVVVEDSGIKITTYRVNSFKRK